MFSVFRVKVFNNSNLSLGGCHVVDIRKGVSQSRASDDCDRQGREGVDGRDVVTEKYERKHGLKEKWWRKSTSYDCHDCVELRSLWRYQHDFLHFFQVRHEVAF